MRFSQILFYHIQAEDKTINKSSHSEFAVDLEDLCFLTVTGYEGKPEVQFLCLQLQRGILYHNGLLKLYI